MVSTHLLAISLSFFIAVMLVDGSGLDPETMLRKKVEKVLQCYRELYPDKANEVRRNLEDLMKAYTEDPQKRAEITQSVNEDLDQCLKDKATNFPRIRIASSRSST